VNKHIILSLIILLFLSSSFFGVSNQSKNFNLESKNFEHIDGDSVLVNPLLPMYCYDDSPVNKKRTQTNGWVHQEGWPVTFEINSTHYSMIYDTVVCDLEGDGYLDVVVTYSLDVAESYVDAYELNGSQKTDLGFPIFLPCYIMSGASIGDLDYDGDVEIVVSAFDNVDVGHALVYVFEFDGEKFVESWHFMESMESATSLFTTALGDIDGDGDLEIVVGNTRKNDGVWEGVFYAWHHNGSMVSGWPVINNNSFGNFFIPALGDIDNDGRLEVIAGSRDHHVFAWNGDGSIVFGNWPVYIGDCVLDQAPQIGDLDGDGDLEVVQVGNNNGSVFILDGRGNIIEILQPLPKDRGGNTPALGDIDGDGDLEVFANIDGYIYGWHHNGTLIDDWPVETGSLHVARLSITLGDVDNDNHPDVLLMPSTPTDCIFSFHADGTLIDGWPYLLSDANNIYSSPLLVDLDNDGDVEVVFTYAWLVWPGSPGSFFKIDILDLNGSYNFSTMHWPMFQHDSRHTGIYGFGLGELQAYVYGPYYGLINNSVSFSCSAIGGYPPYSWNWDFGDGNISDEWNPVHTYSIPDNYTVVLVVTDDSGNTSAVSTWAKIKESNNPPNPPIITGPTRVPPGRYEYTFNATDPNGDNIKYFIDWGDDNTEETDFYPSGQEIELSHSFLNTSVYLISAKAIDILGMEGDWGTISVRISQSRQLINLIFSQFLERFKIFFNI
jgi:hypothetical protein